VRASPTHIHPWQPSGRGTHSYPPYALWSISISFPTIAYSHAYTPIVHSSWVLGSGPIAKVPFLIGRTSYRSHVLTSVNQTARRSAKKGFETRAASLLSPLGDPHWRNLYSYVLVCFRLFPCPPVPFGYRWVCGWAWVWVPNAGLWYRATTESCFDKFLLDIPNVVSTSLQCRGFSSDCRFRLAFPSEKHNKQKLPLSSSS
jgi:hypothetical protein